MWLVSYGAYCLAMLIVIRFILGLPSVFSANCRFISGFHVAIIAAVLLVEYACPFGSRSFNIQLPDDHVLLVFMVQAWFSLWLTRLVVLLRLGCPCQGMFIITDLERGIWFP